MTPELTLVLLALIGLVSGVSAGVFGIGGGVLIVPGLVYLLGFSQLRATGTSLAILLPPVGLAATIEYYRHGNVDVRAAAVVAATLFIGAWASSTFANRMRGPYLRLAFGLFVVALGASLVLGAVRRLGWL